MTEQPEQQAETSQDEGGEAPGHGVAGRVRMRQRLALGAVALIAPLVLVGVVGAATGDEPLDAPVEAVESVAAAVGIGGNSGDNRNDYDNRSETAGNVGQPGSCPGKACDAPGQNQDGDTAEDGTETPEGEAAGTPDGEDTVAVEEEFDPHANGKGCDDKLFAGGEPPFGGPDGPNFETPVGPCGEPDADDADEEVAEGEEAGRPDDPGAEGRARGAEARNNAGNGGGGDGGDDEEVETEDEEDEGGPPAGRGRPEGAGRAGGGN